MLTIDGSFGEGGGQILRTSLSLSLLAGGPVRIAKIRAHRPTPGLGRQHLTAVRAAAEVGGARLEGDEPGSREIVFVPRVVRGGSYSFSTDGAGSTTLILQTLLLPLLAADEPSSLTLEGGTHNPWAPPFDFLDRSFLPLLREMGARASLELERPGFYPAGGGRIRAEIRPSSLEPLELLDRGAVRRVSACARVSALPRQIGERELQTAAALLGIAGENLRLAEAEDPVGPGNSLTIDVESERLTEVFTGFGRKGVPAEWVAEEAAREAEAYLEAGVPVGVHLADQLLLPLAVAGGGRFRTTAPSEHARTSLHVLRRFLEVEVRVRPVGRAVAGADVGETEVWEIKVGR